MSDRPLHLITFLGTGNYEPVRYQWRDRQPVETSLFPTALPRFFPEISSASVFVTEESKTKHWDTLVQQWPADWRPEPVKIPKGASTDELWEIFDKVVHAVPDDCRVVFDITHAFRSIPLISVLAVAYLWSARDIQLHALVYGALEAKTGDPPVAPVFDLTPMVNLLEWLAAMERFRHHLDGQPLQRLLDRIQQQAHQAPSTPFPPPRRLKSIGNAVKRLTDALLLGRVREVLPEVPRLAQALNNPQLREETDRWAKPFGLMLEPLQKLLEDIGQGHETDLKAHCRLARFYNDRRLYPLAITLLRECIISRACQYAGITGLELFAKSRREKIEKELGDLHHRLQEKQALPEEPSWIAPFKEAGLLKLWQRVPDIRNDIDHAGMSEDAKQARTLIKLIRDLFSAHAGA